MKGRPIVLTLFALFNWVVGGACFFVGFGIVIGAGASDVPQIWDAISGLILAAGGLCYVLSAALLHACVWKRQRPPSALIVTQCLTILCVIGSGVMIYNSRHPPQSEGLQAGELVQWFATALGVAVVQLPYVAWLRSVSGANPQ